VTRNQCVTTLSMDLAELLRLGRLASVKKPLSGLGLTCALAVGVLSPSMLQAQDRGTLQVAAQVVSVAPSEQALAQGIALALHQLPTSTQSLATVQLAPGEQPAASTPLEALAPRAVLTISFVTN
jgi:hypothetical protein